jgi:hypothetical protein
MELCIYMSRMKLGMDRCIYVCGLVVEEASRKGGGRRFEPRQQRSRRDFTWKIVGGVPSFKNIFLFIFRFFGDGLKTSVLVPASTKVSMLVWEHSPALRRFVLAQGRWRVFHTTPKTPFSR